jgi:hypothetical protein
MGTVLLIAVAAVSLLAATFVWGQNWLLYFPSRTTVERVTSDDMRPWPSPQDFRGLVAEPRGAVRGTAIVFHGNAGHVGHRARYAHELTPLDLRVHHQPLRAAERRMQRDAETRRHEAVALGDGDDDGAVEAREARLGVIPVAQHRLHRQPRVVVRGDVREPILRG